MATLRALRRVPLLAMYAGVATQVSTPQRTYCNRHELGAFSTGDYKIKVRAGSANTRRGAGGVAPKKDFSNFIIVSGTANTALSNSICSELGTTVAPVEVTRFSDGEITCIINESVRGKDVYLVQSFGSPVNENIMELLLTITALRRSGANSITAVIPYYGYKFHRNRGMPISTTHQSRFLWNAAGDVAKMLATCGVDKVVSVDLQRPGQSQEATFFQGSVPVETIDSNSLFVRYFEKLEGLGTEHKRVVVLSPNTEFVKKAKRFQRKLQEKVGKDITIDYAAFLDDEINDNDQGLLGGDERQSLVKAAEEELLLGDVQDAEVIIIDDIVESGLGLAQLCRRLVRAGAAKINVCASHGVFSQNSMELIDLSMVDRVVVTDSLPLPKNVKVSKKIVQLSVAPLLSRVIETELFQHSNKDGDAQEEVDVLTDEEED